MSEVLTRDRKDASSGDRVRFYGVHHLALNTDDMKMTVDFYVDVLGMRLVHAMKVPPGLGTGPGNRGNPPFEEIRHYFFDMGRDGLESSLPGGPSDRRFSPWYASELSDYCSNLYKRITISS